MPLYPVTNLDLISESQSGKATAANNLFGALSSAALFGIRSIAGLVVNLYGGNLMVSNVPTAIANQQFTATNNTTTYVYSTSAGVVTATTSIPSGWPGPLAAGAIALYEIVAAAGAINIATSSCYLPSFGLVGATGAAGVTGPAGGDFFLTRKRIASAVGNNSGTINGIGFDSISFTSPTGRTLASTNLRTSTPYLATVSGSSAGSSAQIYHARALWTSGNAANVGGYNVSIRFCIENGALSSPANQRSFIGLMPNNTIGNVEPDTLTDIIGVGAKAGEANLSIIYNDSSGTATKTLLVSDDVSAVNFPARAGDNVYELRLQCAANGSTVSFTFMDCGSLKQATGVLNSNLPSSTTFLTWGLWVNNGSTAAACSLGFMQTVGESRY
jgi:hypothetical protein